MNERPVVRAAGPRDLARLLTLYRELRPHDPVLPDGTAREAFSTLLARDGLSVIVCEVGGVLTATCMLVVIPNLACGARPFAMIEHVITLSSQRRRGYARVVLDHALATAWAAGCYKVLLLSGAQRAEAHRLYESVGFVGDVERGFVIKRATP